MKIQILMILLIGLGFTGCTGNRPSPTTSYTQAPAQKAEIFHTTMKAVALSTQKNSKYTRMAFETADEKKWFKEHMFHLWDRQITRREFIETGVKKYPTHKYEFTFIANGFQQRS